MKIQARFESRCPACGDRIQVGSTVEWSKGSAARHVDCQKARAERPVQAVAPAAPAKVARVPAEADAPYMAREKWAPCKRAGLRSAAGETRLYTNPITARSGDTDATAVGVFTVVGQTEVYESAEDNEDMGDMLGAGWHVTLYLRRATPEEEQRDVNERLAPAMVRWAVAMIGMAERGRKARAEAEILAFEREGASKVALNFTHDWMNGAGEVLWEDGRGSYRRKVVVGGEIVYIGHDYVYDWDQPFVCVGPAHIVERAALAESMVSLGWEIVQCAKRGSSWVVPALPKSAYAGRKIAEA